MKAVVHWCGQHRRLLVAGASCALVFSIVLFDLWLMVSRSIAANADGLWLISLAHDLFVGVPFSGWRLPKITLYFPDLLSVVLLRLAGLHVGTTMAVHGVVSWLLVGVGIASGSRLCGVGWLQAVRSAMMGLLICVLAYADFKITKSFQNPFTHGGAALAALLGLVFLGHGLRNGFKRPGAAIGTACLALLVASDVVIIPQFVVPVGMTALLFQAFGWAPRRRLMWVLGMLTLGAAAGAVITSLVKWQTGLTLAALPGQPIGPGVSLAFARFVHDMGVGVNSWPLAFAVALVSIALIVFVVVEKAEARFRRKRSALPEGEELAEWWLACGGIAILGATLGAVIVTQVWDRANHRHILPLFILPPALAVILWSPRVRMVPVGVTRTLEVSLVLLATLFVKQKAKASPPYSPTLYTPRFACLDRYAEEEGLNAGYAEYWKSRDTMVLSRRALTVVEVNWRLMPRRWANNAFWYSRGYWGRDRPPEYDFIIMSMMDKAWLGERFGAPRAQHTCFGLEIWVYDRPEDLEFRNYLRTNAAHETGDHDAWWDASTSEPAKVGTLPVSFAGEAGVELAVPRVAANVIEVSSPTRRALNLTYRRSGKDVASQSVEFKKDARRLLALPASLGADGFDSILVRGLTHEKHELKELMLMTDPKAEAARK